MIFNDHSHALWTEWDFRIIKAFELLQEMTRGDFPVWIADSPRVHFEVVRKTSAPQAAIDRAMKADEKNSVPGRYYVVEMKIDGDGPLPTLEEWVEEQKALETGDGTMGRADMFGNLIDPNWVEGDDDED